MEHEEETKSGVTEIGARTGTAIDPIAMSSSTPPSSQFRVPSDLEEDGLPPFRQSVSMDSSPLAASLSRRMRRKDPARREKISTLQKRALLRTGEI